MAVSFNKVIIAGNLTRDVQVRFIANERAVANFGLAINRRFKTGDGEQKEEVTFVDITAWGKTAELCGQYLAKGRSALVEGHLHLESWEKDGEKRQKLVVVADGVQFLSSMKDAEAAPAPAAKPAPRKPAPADDDSPF